MNKTGWKRLSAASLALLCLASSPAAFSQPAACLAQARSTISPGAWEAAQAYFASLTIGEPSHIKARLIRLRAAIVQLESAKQQLIDVAKAHARPGASGTPLPSDLGLARVPPILQEIESISRSLRGLAAAGNLFAAEPAFRQLVLHVEGKRANSLCSPRRPAAVGPADREALQRLVADLQTELNAIVKAEDALDSYIKRLQ